MRSAETVIVNKAGLHARAASKLVELNSRFASDIRIGLEKMVDGKSVLALMMLAAVKGAALRIEVDGPDENEALPLIVGLIEDGFGENP